MRRLLLTLRYDGTHYHGWQVQPNGVTVQETLQNAVERVTGVRSGITGCSRTDAGVHAGMFCCTFDTDCTVPAEKIPSALNFYLPKDVAVYGCREVAGDFHPRYSARGKRYSYRIWNARERNPFYEGYALHYPYPLDAERMDRLAAAFVGRHDFAAFCAVGSTVEDTVREVCAAGVSREGDLVTFTVEADGFLYNMVRIMVGTLLDAASGHLPEDAVTRALNSRCRDDAGATAPPQGLFLEQVFYDD